MNANANIILEKIKGMTVKAISYEKVGISIEEFNEAIKYIKQKGLLKLVPVYEKGKITMITVIAK